MPSAGERDSFVPPAPATPERKPHAATQAVRAAARPDPFAAADMANASAPRRGETADKAAQPAAPRNKAYSLFRRVTGGFSAAETPAPAGPAAERREPTMGRSETGGQAEREAEREPREPAAPNEPAAARPAGNPTAESRQPRLTGMEPSPASKEEEDLLDIPAFLRRQAN
jgi:cell division protein FtsZ